MKKNPSKKKQRHHWKKAFLNGLQRSTPFKAKQKKEKRDLVSIVPNHRPIKSVNQNNDIILKAENVGISTPDKDESLKPNAKVFSNTNVDGRADTKGNNDLLKADWGNYQYDVRHIEVNLFPHKI